MIVRATASRPPGDASADTRISSGMSAVNAWEDSTRLRSIPSIRMKRWMQRPRNDAHNH